MKKEAKKILKITLALALTTCIFAACGKEKEVIKEETHGNQVETENVKKEEDMNTYGNGNKFVRYKGKTYYREYSNADIEKSGMHAEYGYDESVRNSKYINAISSDGKIVNVFEDDGYGDFYIMNDRFYFSGYKNKLYSVDMTGKDYREICKGHYIKCDENSNKLYYVNEANNNAMYSMDTETFKITKVANEELEVLDIIGDEIIFMKSLDNGDLAISKLNMNDNSVSEIDIIKADKEFNAKKNKYYVADRINIENKLFFSLGYDEELTNKYTNGRLYCLDFSNNYLKLIDKQIDKNLIRIGNDVSYTALGEGSCIKRVQSNNLITYISQHSDFVIEGDAILSNATQGVKYVKENNSVKALVSQAEIDRFVEKYGYSSGDNMHTVRIYDVKMVKNNIFYLMELSRFSGNGALGLNGLCERVATEVHMINTVTNKKTLLYLYKAEDKVEVDSGDVYESGNFEEPLAENEMYLEIKLSDRGAKETFDVRVEEVGGFIIGKRIEYEGRHSRKEEMLKIKVTKEVGAMLTVYIDGKLDTQMLIEE